MNYNPTKFTFIALTSMLFISCGPKEINQSSAQNALKVAVGSTATVSIPRGIQLGSNSNSASADVTITNFVYNGGSFGIPNGVHTFNGNGRASFNRDSDGKWYLRELIIFQPMAEFNSFSYHIECE